MYNPLPRPLPLHVVELPIRAGRKVTATDGQGLELVVRHSFNILLFHIYYSEHVFSCSKVDHAPIWSNITSLPGRESLAEFVAYVHVTDIPAMGKGRHIGHEHPSYITLERPHH